MKPNATQLAESALNASQRERDAWKLAMAEGDTIPNGYRNQDEWGRIWQKGESSTRRVIKALVSSKKMEKKFFRVVQHDGGARPIPHYKLI